HGGISEKGEGAVEPGVGSRESGVGEPMKVPKAAPTPDTRHPTPLRKLLVPNRGEIAVRIARACREVGIESVLGFSEADDIRYVRRYFDDAIALGSGDARQTYLDVARVIDAARKSAADAIHPGYGFLSERAELAAACDEAGIVFIGPKAA